MSNVSLPAWLMAVIVVVSAGVGYASCYFGVVMIGARAMGLRRSTNGEGEHMTKAPRNVTVGFVVIVVLVAMLLVIAGGTAVNLYRNHQAVQEKAAEDAKDHAAQVAYDACLTEWGDKLVHRINGTRAARRAYDNATTARDDATAKVLAVSLGFFTTPPQSTRTDLQHALEDARRADEQVKQAKATLNAKQSRHYQPPTLACADEAADQEEPDQ